MMIPRIATDEWKWLREVQVGDILKVNGKLRVVRGVSHGQHPYQRSNYIFAIKHCSWTHRCYTVYTSSDLITMGVQRMNKSMRLRTKLDRRVKDDIHAHRPKLTCCDVAGMY